MRLWGRCRISSASIAGGNRDVPFAGSLRPNTKLGFICFSVLLLSPPSATARILGSPPRRPSLKYQLTAVLSPGNVSGAYCLHHCALPWNPRPSALQDESGSTASQYHVVISGAPSRTSWPMRSALMPEASSEDRYIILLPLYIYFMF